MSLLSRSSRCIRSYPQLCQKEVHCGTGQYRVLSRCMFGDGCLGMNVWCLELRHTLGVAANPIQKRPTDALVLAESMTAC